MCLHLVQMHHAMYRDAFASFVYCHQTGQFVFHIYEQKQMEMSSLPSSAWFCFFWFQSPLEAWALFYYIGSAIGIITALEFILLGSSELQSWGVDTMFKVVVKYGTSQSIHLGAEPTGDENQSPLTS